MEILAVIPARGGSKGVPRKNIKELGGRPLIAWSILYAHECKQFKDVVVSTDDEEIARVANNLGAEVPFLRDAHLALDSTPTIDVLIDLLLRLKGMSREYDAVCLLQPTTPFRSSNLVKDAIGIMLENNADSVVSMLPVPHSYNPHWVFEEVDASGKLRIATGDKEIIPRRQDLPNAWYRDGALYLAETSLVLNEHKLLGERLFKVVNAVDVPVNIDTMGDWEQAEKVIIHIKGC